MHWITPALNQTHILINVYEETCMTIPCYLYSIIDNRHYEYFDYITNDGKEIEAFDPNSDMAFLDFKKLMKEEWNNRPKDTTK